MTRKNNESNDEKEKLAKQLADIIKEIEDMKTEKVKKEIESENVYETK